MKKAGLLLFLLIISPSYAFAESSSSVVVNNNVSQGSNGSSHTEVRVETNGEVTTYSSNEQGTIEVKSENGKSEIKVNGQVVVQNNTPTTTPVATTSPTKKPTPPSEEEIKKEIEKANKNILEVLDSLFKKLFLLLG